MHATLRVDSDSDACNFDSDVEAFSVPFSNRLLLEIPDDSGSGSLFNVQFMMWSLQAFTMRFGVQTWFQPL